MSTILNDDPWAFFGRILNVWLVSGQLLTSVPNVGILDVRSLKWYLQKFCGVPRFRQRLLHEGMNLADDVELCSHATDLQLVLLSFVQLSAEKATTLQNAVRDGHATVVDEILQLSADPNVELTPGTYLLRDAAIFGHEGIVRLLLDAGSVVVLNSHLWTPVCAACYHGHVEIVSLLLSAGAEKDEISEQGTPLTWAAGGTVSEQRVRVVKVLLKARADVNKVDGALFTPLTSAIQYKCCDEVVQILLRASANPDVICPGNKPSPLCLASKHGSVQQVCMLLDAGADKDQISALRTPLTSAIWAGQTEVVSVLIKAGANLDKADDQFFTPLTLALWEDDIDLVRLLATVRANTDLVCRHYFQTPLCTASAEGRVEMVRLLVLAGAALDRTCTESTPLTLAACAGHEEVVRLLMVAGAAVDRVKPWLWLCAEEVKKLFMLAKAPAS